MTLREYVSRVFTECPITPSPDLLWPYMEPEEVRQIADELGLEVANVRRNGDWELEVDGYLANGIRVRASTGWAG